MHLLAPTGLSSRVLVVPSPGKPSLLALCLPLIFPLLVLRGWAVSPAEPAELGLGPG